jgi:hypothetical protein
LEQSKYGKVSCIYILQKTEIKRATMAETSNYWAIPEDAATL